MTATIQTYNQKLSQLLANKPVILQILKFVAIGGLNTALDFAILNYVTKSFDVTVGVNLGWLNFVSFTAAVVQSYFWNRAWTFANSNLTPLANLFRLIIVGGLGFTSLLLVVIGGFYAVVDTYYLFILVVFLIAEFLIWYAFGLTIGTDTEKGVGHQFAAFIIVSAIGLLINSLIIVLASNALAPSLTSLINADSIKNVSKILATAVSLFWNFIGYKLIVFKK